MKIFLHIGTEKTGSSFLQTLFARHRSDLRAQGVFYPRDEKWERETLAGRISPGNGELLFQLLEKQNFADVQKLLDKLVHDARLAACSCVLISNERLLEVFTVAHTVAEFLRACERASFDKPEMLLVLRDPVSQALSLYKHRAKSGNIADLTEWLPRHYTLASNLRGLLANIDAFGLAVTFRKYKKDPLFLARVVFRDWLRVKLPGSDINLTVNPSLTLSELAVLKIVRQQRPELVSLFYSRLLGIPTKEKIDDWMLKDFYKRKIADFLKIELEVWKKCNERLPADEQLVLDRESNGNSVPVVENVMTFSETQVKTLMNLAEQSSSLKFKMTILYKNIRRRAAGFYGWLRTKK